nr:hypothetical protein [Tanacetum cinerariifolium]
MNEHKERMPTKVELTLEQSQQGVSNDVLEDGNHARSNIKQAFGRGWKTSDRFFLELNKKKRPYNGPKFQKETIRGLPAPVVCVIQGEKEAISWRGIYINAAMMVFSESAMINDLGQIGFRRALFDFLSSFMHVFVSPTPTFCWSENDILKNVRSAVGWLKAVNEKSHPRFWSNSKQLCGYEPPDLRLQLSRRAADHMN